MTGMGKTRAAVHQLSFRSIDSMTWIAMDFKGDDTLAAMPVTDIIELDDEIPDRPGLFYIQVPPSRHQEYTSDFFMKVYQRGECGVLVDETLALGARNDGFNQCLFMGRSRSVPMIMCTQRPVSIEKNARNQVNFFQVMYIGDQDDRDALQKNIPREILDISEPPPGYCSYWFDQRRRWGALLAPSPPEEESMQRIFERMAPPEGTLGQNVDENELRTRGMEGRRRVRL